MSITRRISLLLCFTLLTLVVLWWRWIWLPPSDLGLVQVHIDLPQQEHPLDTLLREYAAVISGSPALLAQLRRAAEPYMLNDLLVDACEVTQGDFGRFANWRALQESPPPAYRATPPDWEFKSQTAEHQVLGQLETAAGGLSFHDAYAYCSAAGGRLPQSAEFEAIASGNSQRLYPWGDEFNNSAWPHVDPSLNISHQCGAYPSTSTPEGIHDLGNSLLEWTTDENGVPVLMGGNAWHRPRPLHALNFLRISAATDFRSMFTGFRCVYDYAAPAGTAAVAMPWGGDREVVAIAGGQRLIGPPDESHIVPLLRAMAAEDIGVLKHLPLVPARLDIQVMRHEVSRALYTRFLRDPLVRLGFFNHPRQPVYIVHEPDNWAQQLQQPSRPVTRVSWWSAWAFARWAGGALPTAEQWQALAGASLQRFPYGNDYQAGRAVDRNFPQPPPAANSQDTGEGINEGTDSIASEARPQSAAVDASMDGSLHGIVGFGGNVAEWTGTSLLRGNAFTVVIKGGSYLMPADGSQVAQTGEAVPDYRSDDLGFRLVFPAMR